MKKVLSLTIAVVMMASLLAGCGSKKEEAPAATSIPATSTPAAEAVNVIKVDIACVSTAESVIGQATQKLTDLLNESGLFEATCYPNGQLGTITDCFESILAGDYLMTIGGGSDWGDVVGEPNMGVIMTPFLMDELDDIYGLTESTLWNDMLAGAEGNGVKIMNYPAVNGSRYFLTPKVVQTPADMAGMMVRVPTSSYEDPLRGWYHTLR